MYSKMVLSSFSPSLCSQDLYDALLKTTSSYTEGFKAKGQTSIGIDKMDVLVCLQDEMIHIRKDTLGRTIHLASDDATTCLIACFVSAHSYIFGHFSNMNR
jgi:hypothetical protein